ncbi:MAG: NrfD/PsrC family molybdoenzyme membrane anchor subunit [Egibacteraceae bacterium]
MTTGAHGRAPVDGEVRTYYGAPVLKEPEWTWEVPWYLFAGGLAGTSSVLAATAALRGNPALARAARLVAAAGAAVSPPLLIADLGRPARFLNMLRVFKPTSAMSVGSWILAGYSPASITAASLDVTGRAPRLRRIADTAAALLGPAMSTYTAVLVADSSVPVWHEARNELPFVFAGSGAAAAGAACVLVASPDTTAPARRLAVGGATVELVAGEVMLRRLGETGEVYDTGRAGAFSKAAKACTAVGAALVALGGGRHTAIARAGAVAVLAGSVCQRWAVYTAGFASAADPKYVVKPQRERLRSGQGHRDDAAVRRR